MTTDVKLNQGQDKTFVVVEARVLQTQASDFMLNAEDRRNGNNKPWRRALVHNQQDGLTINFNGDYSGGVTIVGVAELYPKGEPDPFHLQIPTLKVRGNISYEEAGITIEGDPVMITTSITEEFSKLKMQIRDLTDRLAKLEAK